MSNLRRLLTHKTEILLGWFTICLTITEHSALVLHFSVVDLAHQVLLFVLCLSYSSILVWVLSHKVLYRIWKHEQSLLKLRVIISLGAGILAVVVIPVNPPVWFFGQPYHDLRINATGQHTKGAQGNEVWVQVTGESASCDRLREWNKIDKAWNYKSGYLIANQNDPAKLTWAGFLSPTHDCRLLFIKHSWSGIVKIVYNNELTIIDLYSTKGGTEEFALTVKNTLFRSGVAYVFLVFSLSFLFLLLITWLMDRDIKVTSMKALSWKRVLLYAFPLILWWGVYLFVFYPGLMSSDSFDQWHQSSTGELNDHHPVSHTLTISLLRMIWDSPAVLPIFQILSLAIIAGVVLVLMEKNGANRKLLWVILVLYMLSPANSFFMITLWKDVLYSITFLAMFICFYQIILSNGEWLKNSRNIVLLVISALLMGLYRHNGSYTAWLSLGLLAIFFPAGRKKTLMILLAVFALNWLITGPLYSQLNMKPKSVLPYISVPAHHIAAHLDANTPLTDDEKILLNELRPIKKNWEYTCEALTTIFWPQNGEWFNSKVLEDKEKLKDFLLLSIKLMRRAPTVDIRHTVCMTKIGWRILQPKNSYNTIETVPLYYQADGFSLIEENNAGISHLVTSPEIEWELVKFYKVSKSKEWNWLFWRPALYTYLFILGVLKISTRKRKPEFWLLLIPLAVQIVLMLMLAPGQFVRMYYPVIIVSLLFTPYFLFGISRETKNQSRNQD